MISSMLSALVKGVAAKAVCKRSKNWQKFCKKLVEKAIALPF
jgi:hypothetical protein